MIKNPALKEEDRPHILRDKARAKKFAFEIRRVTGGQKEEEVKRDENVESDKEELKEMQLFKELHLMDPVLRSIKDTGYKVPTEIQQRVIPLAVKGLNVCTFDTNSSKSFSFTLTLIQHFRSWVQQKQEQGRLLLLFFLYYIVFTLCSKESGHCVRYFYFYFYFYLLSWSAPLLFNFSNHIMHSLIDSFIY